MTLPALIDRGPCPLCGDESSSLAIEFREIPIARCASCGFLYSARVMTPQGLADYYAEQLPNRRLQQGQEVFARASLAALERMTPVPRLRHALDVGAGYGFLLSYLRDRHGIKGTGVEPSTVESEHARAQLGIDVRTSLLSNAGLDHSFDLVCAFEVLEHTIAPRQFLAELAGYVAPGGYLVIGTDNFESAIVRALGANFPKWIPHTHISHFSPATLSSLVSELDGFDTTAYTSYTPWEFLARCAIAPIRRPPAVRNAYDYKTELGREVQRSFKFYRLRKAVTISWFKLTASNDLSGEMMFITLHKQRAETTLALK